MVCEKRFVITIQTRTNAEPCTTCYRFLSSNVYETVYVETWPQKKLPGVNATARKLYVVCTIQFLIFKPNLF